MTECAAPPLPLAPVDLFVIGGGINGCGIARDAAGRGLSVELAEMDDLASATSSASTKLFHGGLRYLEFFKFRLVREALQERETLLRAMPHISWPMRFVLPYHSDMRFEGDTPTARLLRLCMPWMETGRRPAWLIRLGLLFYDHLGGRTHLPGTRAVDLRIDPAGAVLQDRFTQAYEYSDCWVQDSRLVMLNARDAAARGAGIHPRTRVIAAERVGGMWQITLRDSVSGAERIARARALVNAAGPWVGEVIRERINLDIPETVRLVRGSHIVTRKLFDHDRCYFFQGHDGRIVFAIPYEQDFTLIGTTDMDHPDPDIRPECSPEEITYLCRFVSEYFRQPVRPEDVIWSYSGVRALYDDGATSATAATRDYVLRIDRSGPAPLLNVFGGKITTYRRLAESALAKLAPDFPQMGSDWTAGIALPGGDFAVNEAADLLAQLRARYPFLSGPWALRLLRSYGTEAFDVLGTAESQADLGQDFGATLSATELRWMIRQEYVRTGEDALWRRTRLGLRLTEQEREAVDQWIRATVSPDAG